MARQTRPPRPTRPATFTTTSPARVNRAIIGPSVANQISNVGITEYDASPEAIGTAEYMYPYLDVMLEELRKNKVFVANPNDIFEVGFKFANLNSQMRKAIPANEFEKINQMWDASNDFIEMCECPNCSSRGKGNFDENYELSDCVGTPTTWGADKQMACNKLQKKQKTKNTFNTIFATLGGAFQGFLANANSTPPEQRNEVQTAVIDVNNQATDYVKDRVLSDTQMQVGKLLLPILIGLAIFFIFSGIFKSKK